MEILYTDIKSQIIYAGLILLFTSFPFKELQQTRKIINES